MMLNERPISLHPCRPLSKMCVPQAWQLVKRPPNHIYRELVNNFTTPAGSELLQRPRFDVLFLSRTQKFR
jgi:hypothetical protein